MAELTQTRLKELIHYCPKTGRLTRIKTRPGPRKRGHVGEEAGSLNDQGYRRVYIDGREYRAHRLAWLYMTGEFPASEIDHINRIRDDNRWDNLRNADRSQNARNRRLASDNKSGITGIHWDKAREKWLAYICIRGRLTNLGRYDDMKMAVDARRKAELDMCGVYFPEPERERAG